MCDVWHTEHPTPSLNTCTPPRAFLEVTTDPGWIREQGWATGIQLHQLPVLTTVSHTQGFLALFRAVFTAGLIPGLTPPNVASICSTFDFFKFFFSVFAKNITNNNCCLHRSHCHLCCLLRGTDADRKGSFDFDPILRITHFLTQILLAERPEIHASSVH